MLKYPWIDTAQVCLNGHLVGRPAESIPDIMAKTPRSELATLRIRKAVDRLKDVNLVKNVCNHEVRKMLGLGE